MAAPFADAASSPNQEDLTVQRPLAHEFRVVVGQCTRCHRRVQGRHPLQTSDALGAAAVQHGPQAVAFAVVLNEECGLSFGRFVRLVRTRFDLTVTRGGLVHAVHRAARQTTPTYDALCTQTRRPMRLRSSCGRPGVRARPRDRPRACVNRLGGLLARRPSRLADARRFATHLTAEYNAVLSFLFDPTLDATNWRAEHALRPAVVTRKMCGGGKRSVRGAQSQQMLASILRTAHQRGLDATAVIVAALRRRGPSSSTPFNRLRYTDPLNRDKDFSFVFFVPFVAKDSVSFVARRLATKDKK